MAGRSPRSGPECPGFAENLAISGYYLCLNDLARCIAKVMWRISAFLQGKSRDSVNECKQQGDNVSAILSPGY